MCLLERCEDFLKHVGVREGQIKAHLMTNPERQLAIKAWKREYHTSPPQVALQAFDRATISNSAVKQQMHKRFHLHQQRGYGTKQIAETICSAFAGTWNS